MAAEAQGVVRRGRAAGQSRRASRGGEPGAAAGGAGRGPPRAWRRRRWSGGGWGVGKERRGDWWEAGAKGGELEIRVCVNRMNRRNIG
jgi:hypothetical protein